MSRYRASGDFAYREPPAPPRWDTDRFQREREYRDYQEFDEYYQPAAPPPRRAARPVYEEERVYREDDRFGPRGSRIERQYFEEDEYYDPRVQRGQVIPFRPPRPSRPEAPPRPGLLRRQSSLDTFDRPPARRYEDLDEYRPPPPRRPPRIDIDVPEQPSPRGNRYRPARPSRPVNDYYEYDQSAYYDDVAIQDPDYYGDDGFRGYREREWISSRKRDSSSERSQTRSRPPTEAPVEEKKVEKKETVRKEEIKEEVKEKPYPRRGKTKMPKRLVHTKVLFDLGYPFYEENDKTLIIEKALGPDNIDEVFAKSREYREKEVSTTRLIEAPPAPPPARPPSISVRSPPPRPPTVSAPSVHEDFRESVFKEEIRTKPLSEAPRSVREWDQMTAEDAISVRISDRRKSTARSRSRRRSNSPKETIVERRSTIIEREPSRSPEPQRRRRRKSKSRRRSSSVDETEIVERRIVTEEDDFFPGESNSVHVGPLALVVDRDRENRTEREIRAKIRELEREQQSLKYERSSRIIDDDEYVRIENRTRGRDDDIVQIVRQPSRSRSRERLRDRDVVRIERRERSRSSDGTDVIIEKTVDDGVEVRKSVRERSISRARAPSSGLVKAMLYTAT